MSADDLTAAGDVLATGLRETTTSIEAVHRQIARRSFGATGRPATPVRVLHDAISAGVYASVRAGLTVAARGGALAAAATEQRWSTPERTRLGAQVRGAINGAWGDHLERAGSGVVVPMAIRLGGHDVPLERDALAAAFPDARGRVVVLVHGLCETEHAWKPDGDASYGRRLERDLPVSAVTLRYNTGLPVRENGGRLDALLDALLDAWPVRVDELVLVGHSMGGLVIRSACHQAADAQRPWLARVGHAVYLGSPHGGSAVEKGARLAVDALRRVPELRPVAAAIDSRSAGVQDMWFGEFHDEHVPLAPVIRHHAVAATLGATPGAPLSVLFGDLLVRHDSAMGRGARGREDLVFADGDVLHVPGAHHFHLLAHDVVYERLRAWLEPRGLPAGA